ncbi:hypothetical protein AVEN_214-1 [Araneus ventricosus]|uniref:Uncharacterized protein n=1 Tax=Araneus ventricosus TaxID=182803 RepID=A0A4Y2PUG5_ARAVE|nr:hypothetical protein AVEN_214-1 [Araneus ventricosus]
MPQTFTNKLPQERFSQHYKDNLCTIPVTDCRECVAFPDQEFFMNKFVEPRWRLVKKNPQAWKEDFRFKEMKTFIKKLKVVNDRWNVD